MLAFDLPLLSTTRPIVNLYDFTAMLDTGAGIPTFYMPVEIVLKLFGGKQIGITQVKGASGDTADAVICRIEHFDVGNVSFRNIPVVVCEDENAVKNVECDILLGSNLWGEGSTLTIYYGDRHVTCDLPESSLEKNKLWYYREDRWRCLDFSEKLSTWVIE
ncbi:MAG TPA: hypothetical protein DIS68_03945 [Lachnospiraceae bacterium]|nr:hypothetical protein [Lachnospiraceae bacterium]